MKIVPLVLIHICSWGPVFTIEVLYATAAERRDAGAVSYARQATFEITYANKDLVRLGDPASPAALAYLKPDARPIATDFYVTKIVENRSSLHRYYFREARIAHDNDVRTVYAFTARREKAIGTIGKDGRFSPNEFYKENRELLRTWPEDTSSIAYDARENALYQEVKAPGPQLVETLDFLPLAASNVKGRPIVGHYFIQYAPPDNGNGAAGPAVVSLTLTTGEKPITLAKAVVPRVLRQAGMRIGSFDNGSGTYLPEAAYREGASGNKDAEPSVTIALTGEFTPAVKSDSENLVVISVPPGASQPASSPAAITIDGNFDDWRNVAGVDDPRGDLAPYLEYVPDVDLLEFKVAHDDEHIFLYARVAGQVGRSHPDGGRSYFYAYMDVDQNAETGFLPTRDDECYYGVDIGDDCEVQFEFVDNKFRKTFYGFCGLGGDDDVLKQVVTIGKSQYGRLDENGAERAHYKSEYIYRGGVTEITEDLKLGTSDSIQLAISPDGSEVEVASTFNGFLKDRNGRPIVSLGQTIDIAAGMECDSKAYVGKTKWAADSTGAIRGYQLSSRGNRSR